MKNTIHQIYVITDTHWGHDKMQEYCARPPNFNELIIRHWQNAVSSQDMVIHLGDVTFWRQEKLKEVLFSLPGTKILVRGNHDRNHTNNWFVEAGFAAVCEKIQISGIIFSHTPAILRDEEIEKGIFNVHGHFHNIPAKKWETEIKKKITDHHYLLTLEDINYTPVNILKLRKRKEVKNSKKMIESESL